MEYFSIILFTSIYLKYFFFQKKPFLRFLFFCWAIESDQNEQVVVESKFI